MKMRNSHGKIVEVLIDEAVRPGRGRTAFTLVEMLVTVAIIAVLAALMLPAISSVKETGKEMKCSSNLRQVFQAIEAYTVEDNGRYPRLYFSSEGGNVNYFVWQYYVLPYVGKNQTWSNGEWARTNINNVFNCPSRPADPTLRKTSYAFNSFVWDTPWERYKQRNPKPSGIVLLGEIDGNTDNLSTSDGKICVNPGNVGNSTWGMPAFRHHGKKQANYVFCDGHVEKLSSNQLVLNPTDGNSLWRWW